MERELKIVTDYTGMETLCMSLDILGRKYKLLSMSETNAGARRFVEENFRPKEIRECAEITPMDQCKNCDLYCAGFPCQDFSYNNTARTGTSSYRGQAYRLCVERIKYLRPKRFILENVPAFAKYNSGQLLEELSKHLRKWGYKI